MDNLFVKCWLLSYTSKNETKFEHFCRNNNKIHTNWCQELNMLGDSKLIYLRWSLKQRMMKHTFNYKNTQKKCIAFIHGIVLQGAVYIIKY